MVLIVHSPWMIINEQKLKVDKTLLLHDAHVNDLRETNNAAHSVAISHD
jgi:hypothetical protein